MKIPRSRKSEALEVRIQRWSFIDVDSGCWNWQGRLDRDGYGQFGLPQPTGRPKTLGAHRAAYIIFKGEITEGLHVDHLCRNRRCVNPSHLSLVSPAQNLYRGVASKTHCKNGHERNSSSHLALKGNKYRCKVCAAETKRKWLNTEIGKDKIRLQNARSYAKQGHKPRTSTIRSTPS